MQSGEVLLFVAGYLTSIMLLLEFVEFVFVMVDLFLLRIECFDCVCHLIDVVLEGFIERVDPV